MGGLIIVLLICFFLHFTETLKNFATYSKDTILSSRKIFQIGLTVGLANK